MDVEMLAKAILKAVEARARLLIYLYNCGDDVDCIKEACVDAAHDVASAFKLSSSTAEKIARRVMHEFTDS